MSGFMPGPYSPPLVYRSISEWQQLALSGQLRPEHQLYDPDRGACYAQAITLRCDRTFPPRR